MSPKVRAVLPFLSTYADSRCTSSALGGRDTVIQKSLSTTWPGDLPCFMAAATAASVLLIWTEFINRSAWGMPTW